MTPVPEELVRALPPHYRLERELARGGMAVVYLAHDDRHDRTVAIKVLDPTVAAAAGGTRFLTEVRTTAALQHPHILPLHDSGQAAGYLWYVMPFIPGASLRGRLERERTLPIADAVRIAGEVAEALAHAHGHGVLHRDIKPENILLQDGHAVVADFGIALAMADADDHRLTATGLSLGTPRYMSPEQASGERQLDARSDIFALGCVLYEMLAGEPPWDGPTARAIHARMMTTAPTPLHALRAPVPRALERVVETALARDPADRYGSSAEFGEALRRSLVAGADPTDQRPVQRATGSGQRRWVRWAAVLAMVGVTAVGAAVLRRENPAPSPDLTMAGARQITTSGEAHGPAISPDGGFLAYIVESCAPGHHGCLQRLLVRDLGSDSRPAVAADSLRAIFAPRWNADGTRLIFLEDDTAGVRIVSVPRLGGELRVHGRYLAWAEHPTRPVAAAVAQPGVGDSVLRVVLADIGSGVIQREANIPGRMVADLRWSPDGRWLALTVPDLVQPVALVVLSADLREVARSPEPRLRGLAAQVRWAPTSDGLFFLSMAGGSVGTLFYRPLDAQTGRPGPMADPVLTDLRLPQFPWFDLSPDGQFLVYTSGQVVHELWTAERTGTDWRTERVLTSTARLGGHDIAADGSTIYWAVPPPAGERPRHQIYRRTFTGGEGVPVGPPIEGLTEFYLPRWMGDTIVAGFRAPDGAPRTLLLDGRSGGTRAPPSEVVAMLGMQDGGRLVFAGADPPRLEVRAPDGRLRHVVQPDDNGPVNFWAHMHAGDAVPVVRSAIVAGTFTTVVGHYDPVTDHWGPVRRLPDTGWSCCPAGLTGDRIALPTVPARLGRSEPMQLRVVAADPAEDELLALPLPWSSFSVSPDLGRGVGTIVTSVSDIWLVRAPAPGGSDP